MADTDVRFLHLSGRASFQSTGEKLAQTDEYLRIKGFSDCFLERLAKDPRFDLCTLHKGGDIDKTDFAWYNSVIGNLQTVRGEQT